MESETGWELLLKGAAVGIIVAAIGVWINKSRFQRQPSGSRRLLHPASTLVLGFAVSASFAALAVLCLVCAIASDMTLFWWLAAAFAGFALLGAPWVSGFFLEKHEVSEDGIAFRNFAGTRKYLRWSDLRSVRYDPGMNWFRLETQSGVVARISVMLIGLPPFARLLLDHAPGGAIDPATLDALEKTAAGKPPPINVD